jgi:alkylation response protein AidB-like acyl-CoA dehydrogenase
MSELKSLIRESVSRVFADNVTAEIRAEAERSPLPADLWALCIEQGFDQFLVPESFGGAGGKWDDASPLVRGCGEFAVPLPLPESLAARWLIAMSGLPQPDGTVTLAPQTLMLDGESHVTGSLSGVPWGKSAGTIVAVCSRVTDTAVALLKASAIEWHSVPNLAGEPRDDATIVLHAGHVASLRCPAELPQFLGALLRSGQIAGASLALLERSVGYARERKQFGRALGQFQVIQHNLARLAAAAAASNAAASAAFRAADHLLAPGPGGKLAQIAIAVAKCRTSELADSITAIAHQVHGAMGFTAEVGLHHLTRRLWSWRAEFGSASMWAQWLGAHALRRGPDRLWADLTAAVPNS